MDGTTGQARYHQADSEGSVPDDHSLFTVTMTPLQLKTESGEVLWENETPQSIRSVRPILLEFAKEEVSYVIGIHENVTQQIKDLEVFMFHENGKTLRIICKFFETMIDGKILNMLTGTKSSQSCPVCKSTPKEFNDPNRNKFKAEQSSLIYGCQPLHATINILNCLLHISYRLKFKVWQARTPEHKVELKRRKREVQELILKEFKVRIDMPKEGSTGNTTTGSICKKLFAQPEKLSNVLGLEKDLVRNLAAILIIINSKEQIDTNAFDDFCAKTYALYLNHYKWYPMPATLHKILVHAKDIMTTLPLSTGFMSEQGAEARNKYCRSDRLNHGRKTSRAANMADVFYRAMDSSDPVMHVRRSKLKVKDLGSHLKELGFSCLVDSCFDNSSEIELGDYGLLLESYDGKIGTDE